MRNRRKARRKGGRKYMFRYQRSTSFKTTEIHRIMRRNMRMVGGVFTEMKFVTSITSSACVTFLSLG